MTKEISQSTHEVGHTCAECENLILWLWHWPVEDGFACVLGDGFSYTRKPNDKACEDNFKLREDSD